MAFLIPSVAFVLTFLHKLVWETFLNVTDGAIVTVLICLQICDAAVSSFVKHSVLSSSIFIIVFVQPRISVVNTGCLVYD